MPNATIPSVEVNALGDSLPDGTSVLDVREDAEWHYGHIEGALHVPLMDLPARLGELPEGRMLVVCRVGGRSAQAVAWLQAQGRDAVNLEGGMLDWAAAGRPMVSDTGTTPRVV